MKIVITTHLTKGDKMTTKKPERANASQKLEALEKEVLRFHKQNEIIIQEIDRIANLMNKLGDRLNAMIRLGDLNQPLNSKNVKKLLMEGAAKELKEKADHLVGKNVLKASETGEVGEKSFVVVREVNASGEEINPRAQFVLSTLEKESQDLMLGKKVGDYVQKEGNDNKLEILEVYEIVQPSEPEAKVEETNVPTDSN